MSGHTLINKVVKKGEVIIWMKKKSEKYFQK